MMREIVKDIEDYEGDAETGCKTMPVVWGIRASKAIVGGLISNTMLLLIFIFYKLHKQGFNILSAYLFLFVFIPLIGLILKLYKAQSKNDYSQLSKWLKFIMITGVLSTVVIYLSCYGFI
jgi:4-hydroxybenzoate polyprenyltransferase